MPAFMGHVDEPAWAELLFVRDLARSGVPRAALTEMLKQLPRPFLYDPCSIAYSFRYGWVELPTWRAQAPDPGRWSLGVDLKWVEIAARCGQRGELRWLLGAVHRARDVVDSQDG